MMLSSMLIFQLCIGLCFLHIIYIINHLPSSVLENKSPFETLFHSVPNYGLFKPFGTRVNPCLRDYASHKLAPRSRPCIFLGYSVAHKGFRCYDTSSSKMFITWHAQFNENHFLFSTQVENSNTHVLEFSSFLESTKIRGTQALPKSSDTPHPLHNLPSPCSLCPNDLDNNLVSGVQPLVDNPAPTAGSDSDHGQFTPASTHVSSPSSFTMSNPHDDASSSPVVYAPQCRTTSIHPMQTWAKSGIFKPKYVANIASTALLSALVATLAPKGFKSASKYSEWMAAMQEEIDALHANKTWE